MGNAVYCYVQCEGARLSPVFPVCQGCFCDQGERLKKEDTISGLKIPFRAKQIGEGVSSHRCVYKWVSERVNKKEIICTLDRDKRAYSMLWVSLALYPDHLEGNLSAGFIYSSNGSPNS